MTILCEPPAHPTHSSSFLQLHHEEAAETPAILTHGSWNYFQFWIKLGGLVPGLGSLGPGPYLDEEPTVSVAVPCGCLQGNHLNKRHLFRCTLWWLSLISPLLEQTNVIWPLRSKDSEWLDGRTSHQTKLVCDLTENKALFCQNPEARALLVKATRLNTPSLIVYYLGGVTVSQPDSPYPWFSLQVRFWVILNYPTSSFPLKHVSVSLCGSFLSRPYFHIYFIPIGNMSQATVTKF